MPASVVPVHTILMREVVAAFVEDESIQDLAGGDI